MAVDLRDKLRQLGVAKGAAHISPASAGPRRRQPLASVFDGHEIDSAWGPAFVIEKFYALDHVHGSTPLAAFLGMPAAPVAQVGREPALANVDVRHCLFLDTEPTGLAGGAGTFAFLVGVGRFEDKAFCLRQFFLREPSKEPAMLAALSEQVEGTQALVTFNGRGFDVPLLQARYTLARQRPAWLALPHLDLLMPARRVWRDRLPSCALSALETAVLGVRREQDDVPGYLIPQLYLDYLRTGDASEMPRVLYHNGQDILSMITLAAQLVQMFAAPLSAAPNPDDLVSLGQWYVDLGWADEAERVWRAALERALSPLARVRALARLGMLLKQRDRRAEAVSVWEQLARLNKEDVAAQIELAKHFEWQACDWAKAARWTQAALRVAADWPPGSTRDETIAQLEHRLERLQAKRARGKAKTSILSS